LLLLTDVTGVLNQEKELIPKITSTTFSELTSDGTITGELPGNEMVEGILSVFVV
jgi:acetylglutamate kinase